MQGIWADSWQKAARKLKKNARNTDILARFGGNEVAIIMPNTELKEAKYYCEYLLYNLSCTMFDDLGQLKFSCGISMYPESTDKQDKLTVLAQQALYVAKSKRAQTGQSEIASTSDYNFWDDEVGDNYGYVEPSELPKEKVTEKAEGLDKYLNY